MSYAVRSPAKAGSWYDADPRTLGPALDGWLDDSTAVLTRASCTCGGDAAPTPSSEACICGAPRTAAPPPGPLLAVIAPHAGYSYAGAVAAAAFAAVEDALVDAAAAGSPVARVVVLGPSHHMRLRGCALTGARQLGTPLGPLEVDTCVRGS